MADAMLGGDFEWCDARLILLIIRRFLAQVNAFGNNTYHKQYVGLGTTAPTIASPQHVPSQRSLV